MEAAILTAFFAALILAAIRYWEFTLGVLVIMVLATSCSKADTRFEISAVIESEADRTTMQDAVRDARALFQDQLGIDLTVTYVDIGTVADHTRGEALLNSLVTYRTNSALHSKADATVLFTRRELIRLAGIATVTPACSASASAVVAVRNDGFDGQILAHELLHTLGVPHDHAPGYLMSETMARPGSNTISQDSVLTVRAAGLDQCMAVTPPPTVQPIQQAPAQSSTGGGGGAMEWWFLLAMGVLMFTNRQVKS